MSQYPSPYYPPNVSLNYAAPPDLLAPARRASVLMWILGPLGMLLGTCFISMPMILRAAPGPQADQMRQQFSEAAHAPIDVVFPVAGVICLIPSVLLIVLGFFVRRGRRGPTLSASILVGLMTGYWLINTVAGLFSQRLDAKSGFAICMGLGIVSVFGLLLSWLVAAFRVSGKVATAQQQYAAQYWQYQQNMQAYAQQQQQGYPTSPYAPQGYATASEQTPVPPAAPPSLPVDPKPTTPVDPKTDEGPPT